MKTYLRLVFISIIAIVTSANGQVPQQWQYMMQFKGYWQGNAELNLGGQIFNLLYHTNFKSDIGGMALTMDEGFSDPVLGELKGANLIGLNAADGLIHWFSADNFGTAHEHTGAFTNSKHLHIEHSSMQGGLPFVERIDFTLNANNKKITVYLVATLGPDTVETISGVLNKGHNPHRATNSQSPAINNISVFPNPTTGEIEISNDEAISEIKVVNEAGQVVYKATPMEPEFVFQIDTKGIYFVTVNSGEATQTKKIIVLN